MRDDFLGCGQGLFNVARFPPRQELNNFDLLDVRVLRAFLINSSSAAIRCNGSLTCKAFK